MDSGAAIGAGSGLLLGSAAGPGAYETSAYALQNRYDITYVQCMYAKGNQVPVSAAYRDAFSRYQPPSAGSAAACSTRGKTAAFPTRRTATAQQSGETDFDAVGIGLCIGRLPCYQPVRAAGSETRPRAGSRAGSGG
jgi:hypothetical protein